MYMFPDYLCLKVSASMSSLAAATLLKFPLKCNQCCRSQILRQTSSSTTAGGKSGYGGSHVLLIVPIVSAGLALWQVIRRERKLEIIKSIHERVGKDAVLIYDVDLTADKYALEYQKVTVTGRFEHESEMYIEHRPPFDPTKTPSSQWKLASGARARGDPGVQIVTPFLLDQPLKIGQLSGNRILINRGWIPLLIRDPESRVSGQISGTVTITGLIRKSDIKNPFMPESVGMKDCEKNRFLRRNVEGMAEMRGCLPLLIEADYESTVDGGPVGGQTRVAIYNKHNEYIATWAGISLTTGYLWYQHIYKAKKFSKFFK